MKTLVSLLALAALAGRPAAAQSFNVSGNPWLQKTIPYASTVTIPLAAASTFKLTLTGDATSVATQAAGAKGKHVAFLICQDASTGSHLFTWPAGSYGGAAVPAMPGWCLAQQFLIADGQMWATSNGAQSSLIPPPSMLSYPLLNGHHYNQGGFTISNSTYGVLASNTLAMSNGYHAYLFDGIGHNYDGDNQACIATASCRPRSITVTFYYDTPPAGSEQSFGVTFGRIANADPGGTDPFESCMYSKGAGYNLVEWVGHYWRLVNTDTQEQTIASLGSATFNDPTSVMMLRLSQFANGDKVCQHSTDRGATWSAGFNSGHSLSGNNWGSQNSAGHMGLIAYQPDTADRVYVLGITVIE